MREKWVQAFSQYHHLHTHYGKIDEDRMYEKVRRENNIVTVKGGGGLTITATGFEYEKNNIYILSYYDFTFAKMLSSMASDCCTISSGVVVAAPDNDAVEVQPSTYGITLYDKYLCTSEAITGPTTSSANADLTNCVRTFQSTAGSVVSSTDVHLKSYILLDGTFTRPPPGVYTHGVWCILIIFFY